MTPDRRLDQLEPLLADALQKIDRLVEGQDKLVDFAANTKAELSNIQSTVAQVKSTGEITANGLAELTITVNQIANEQTNFRHEVIQNFAGLKAEVNQGITNLKSKVSQAIATLKAGQALILQTLREKLP